eukprot:6987705-Prymnesium_polylepis.2
MGVMGALVSAKHDLACQRATSCEAMHPIRHGAENRKDDRADDARQRRHEQKQLAPLGQHVGSKE